MNKRENVMITVFTPTYNRKNLLLKLKKSLDAQTSKNFEWIIVDDGSNDGTDKLVSSWQNQVLDYHLIYVKQKNQGKHIAFNVGVENATTDWFFCVDSDDTLTPDTIKIIIEDTSNLAHQYIGLIYPRIMSNENNSASWAKINNTAVDIMDLHNIYGIAETAIVLKTDMIKDLPFPKFNRENFLPESWLYQKLIRRGKLLALNKQFYVSEYLDEGLTKKVWQLWRNNPQGIFEILQEQYVVMGKYSGYTRLVNRVKCVINLNALCMATKSSILKKTPSKILSMITYLPSIYFYIQRYKNL